MSDHLQKEPLIEEQKYIQITHNGTRVVQTTEEAKTFIDSIEENEVYAFRVVYMRVKDFYNLPEFTGF